MIDIHAHILPQVDDGPDSLRESLAILRKGIADGIGGVVCTSHVLDRLDDGIERKFIGKFNELKKIVRETGLSIDIWLGSEIHCHARFSLESKVATLNGNGKYPLLELPLGEIPHDVGDIFFQLTLKGVSPILAHPERNVVIMQRPSVAYEFVQRGVLLQLNAGSITGDFGKKVKKTAYKMFDHQIVHFVASDCHSPRSRPMVLSKAYKVVARRWGKETAERLFQTNPYKAVTGEDITIFPPLPFDGKRSR